MPSHRRFLRPCPINFRISNSRKLDFRRKWTYCWKVHSRIFHKVVVSKRKKSFIRAKHLTLQLFQSFDHNAVLIEERRPSICGEKTTGIWGRKEPMVKRRRNLSSLQRAVSVIQSTRHRKSILEVSNCERRTLFRWFMLFFAAIRAAYIECKSFDRFQNKKRVGE